MNAMKKCLGMLGLVLAMCFATAASAQNQNFNSLEGKAQGALGNCLAQYQGGWDIQYAIGVVDCFTEPCPVDYFVTVIACPVCPQGSICALVPCQVVGTVEFKNGKVVNVISNCD